MGKQNAGDDKAIDINLFQIAEGINGMNGKECSYVGFAKTSFIFRRCVKASLFFSIGGGKKP